MADTSSQKALFDLLSKHFQAGTMFSRSEILASTEWNEVSLSTYESKQFGTLYSVTSSGQYRVTETFRRYSDWKDFRKLVSQKKNTMFSKYLQEEHNNPIVFEFFLPLAHEVHLRDALDTLFYRDRLLALLRTKDIVELRSKWPGTSNLTDGAYLDELADWLGSRFAGYSIGQVGGRYRAGDFSSKKDAASIELGGQKYLIDETTAVVRFIFPVDNPKQVDPTRYFFRIVFIETILEVVDKEAEVWVLESGAANRLYIWRREEV
jgi:hypothetical protein